MSSNPENVEPSRGVRSGGNREFPTLFWERNRPSSFCHRNNGRKAGWEGGGKPECLRGGAGEQPKATRPPS